jgi:hypothetical protein
VEQPLVPTSIVERLKSQIMLMYLIANNTKGLNKIVRIGYGHLCLREIGRSSFNKLHYLGTVNFKH